MKNINDYHIHEALDRTSVLMDMVESTLFDHPGITKQEWHDKLEEAHQALFDLYQMIGAEHLK
jgi:hypothetical protein